MNENIRNPYIWPTWAGFVLARKQYEPDSTHEGYPSKVANTEFGKLLMVWRHGFPSSGQVPAPQLLEA